MIGGSRNGGGEGKESPVIPVMVVVVVVTDWGGLTNRVA